MEWQFLYLKKKSATGFMSFSMWKIQLARGNIILWSQINPMKTVYAYTSVNGLLLVQLMACYLFGAKPSSEPMLIHYEMDSKEQTSDKFQ